MSLPLFRYHPDPLASGSIVEQDSTCPSCEKARGYAYVTTPYAIDDVENLCPWCIADGSAALKFDATFVDDAPLVAAGVSQAIIDEVCRRTPGFVSWQGESWRAHCGDACAFRGEATSDELKELGGPPLQHLQSELALQPANWRELLETYEPGGSPAFYSFECLHCGLRLYSWDCD